MSMPIYTVKLESKPILAEESHDVIVRYESPEYKEAWVGARTVCRLGTSAKRVFKVLDDKPFSEAALFECGPATYTVRHIFAENTRKKGKKRMAQLTFEQLMSICDERKVKLSVKAREVLEAVMADDGVRVTVAVLRKLGVTDEGLLGEVEGGKQEAVGE